MICSECGNEFEDTKYLFCPICGAKSPNLIIPPELNDHGLHESEAKHAIPQGFISEPSTGIYYLSKKKQLSNGSYVNEITWFNSKSGVQVVKNYSMTPEQINSMSYEEKYRLSNPDPIYIDTYNEESTYIDVKSKKKKILIGSILSVCVVLVLGVCAWMLDLLPFGKPKKTDSLPSSKEENELQNLAGQDMIDDVLHDDSDDSGYVFTKLDKQYFYPNTKNYIIIKQTQDSEDEYIFDLFCFDHLGNCTKHYLKMVCKEEQEPEVYYAIKGVWEQSFHAYNFHLEGNIIYYEEPPEEAGFTQSDVNRIVQSETYKVVVNETGGSREKERSEQEGYTFTEDDEKYFKPISDHYVILSYSETQILLCFNDSGVLIQDKLRASFDREISPDLEQQIRDKARQDNMYNVVIVNGVVYGEIKIDGIVDIKTALFEFKKMGCTVLVDKE